MFSTPNVARGRSGSLTLTISRNMRLMSANAVTTITAKIRRSLSGSNGWGMPAMREPMITRNIPASTALTVPEMLNPAISSNFVIGVTR